MKRFLAIFLLIVFLITGGVLISREISNLLVDSSDQYYANVGAIESLKLLDARWSLIAVSTLNNPDSSFDKLADFLPAVRKLRNTLEVSSLQSSATPDVIKYQVRRFLLQIEAKEDLIEQFKSSFAIIRNSLEYFPLASHALMTKMREQGDAAATKEISEQYERITAFLQKPTEGAKVRLLIELNRMNEKVMSYPQEISIPLGNFVSHARVLVERKIQLNDILESLTNRRAIDAGDELLATYGALHAKQREYKNSEAAKGVYINLGLAVAVTLFGVYSSLLLWRKDRDFEKKLASGIEEKTEHLEDQKAESSQLLVSDNIDRNLEDMGRMAATVAHEINTPLGYLDGNLQVLHNGMKKVNSLFEGFSSLQQDINPMHDANAIKLRLENYESQLQNIQDEAMFDELPSIAEDMQEGIEQIKHVVNDLKEFTRKDRSDKDWMDLKQSIQSALKMAGAEIPESTTVKLSLSEIPKVYGAPAEINQVLINLIVNASHAISDAGRIHGMIKIETRCEKENIILSILDNGAGMDAATREKIFDPYYTTKEVGKGTGLGLAVVRRIIKDHGGRIHVKSIQGKGTNFIIVLPVKPISD